MKKLNYSPDAIEKLEQIKEYLSSNYGTYFANGIIQKITSSLRELQQFELKAPSVESVIGIPCDYRMLYTEHHYIFYRVTDDTIWIVDIYNEKEDFMWKLFGIKTTTQETEDYWKE